MNDIISVSRHRMGTDGQGVTTLVGFYGCPLDCQYCINRGCNSPTITRAEYTPEELVDLLSIDAPYFLMTGGGVTFGGGEPLLHAAFIHKVCLLMDPRWNKTIETSLFADWAAVEILKDIIDYWIVDIKSVDPAIYQKYTMHENDIVLRNLKMLVEAIGVEKICVRYPLIPDYSTEENRENGIDYLLREVNPNLTTERFAYIKC